MRNHTTGDVICDYCGKPIGNYLYGDGNYKRLISIKYHPECKPEADRERKRIWQRNKRAEAREIRQQEKKNLQLLREEYEMLLQRYKELKENGS